MLVVFLSCPCYSSGEINRVVVHKSRRCNHQTNGTTMRRFSIIQQRLLDFYKRSIPQLLWLVCSIVLIRDAIVLIKWYLLRFIYRNWNCCGIVIGVCGRASWRPLFTTEDKWRLRRSLSIRCGSLFCRFFELNNSLNHNIHLVKSNTDKLNEREKFNFSADRPYSLYRP